MLSGKKISKPITIQYRLPLKGIKVSTNEIYAGIHWAKRKQIKDSILSIAAGFCRPIQKIGSYPVEIRYRFIFGSNGLDTLNCAYMAKMFEDAFRSLGILEDDDPAHVATAVLTVIELPRTKNAKGSYDSRAKANAEDKDWVEIEINSL
jgi:hypothetical protein